ncbi:MAG TPA: hypothetical protein VEW28_08910 [Candidatus Kapabacteria bacterium]|nr:hypothetical protein [Candidatus Kapabacteria bacterium]
MIPSRPLDLAGIFAETIRIIKKTYLYAAIVALIFTGPGLAVMLIGADRVADDTSSLIRTENLDTPAVRQVIHDQLIRSVKHKSTLLIYRFQYPNIFEQYDSVHDILVAKYPGDSGLAMLQAEFDSLTHISRGAVNKNAEAAAISTLIADTIFFGAGLLLVILGVFFGIGAQYELSIRAFEERPFHLTKIFKHTLTRHGWLLMVQTAMLVLVMMLGLSVVVGIASAISAVLGVFAALGAIGVIIYMVIRLMFSWIVLVSEGTGPVASATRSMEYTGGHFWRIVGITFIGGLGIAIVGAILKLPFNFIFKVDTHPIQTYISGENTSLVAIVDFFRYMVVNLFALSLVSGLLTASFSPAFMTAFYYDLRTRLDGPIDYYESGGTHPTSPPPSPEPLADASSAAQSKPPETNVPE